MLKGSEIRYQKIEKMALIMVITVWKLRHYFQGHHITIKTNYPIKQILKNPNLAGRIVSRVVELSKYDIPFEFRSTIKFQLLAYFLVKLSSPSATETSECWVLFVDKSSNLKGSGARLVLEGPVGIILE